MKSIIILSDTHGNTEALRRISPLLAECDYVFHLGDGMKDMNAVLDKVSGKLISVKGNCDVCLGDKEKFVEIEGKKLLLVHGDLFGVKQSLTRLSLYARERGADAVFYGHSHRADILDDNGILYVNPGTLGRYAAERTFVYAVIANGKIVCSLRRLSEACFNEGF